MAGVVSCSCGARIKVPERSAGKTFRCPRCKTEIEVVRPVGVSGPFGEVSASPSVATQAETDATCPICLAGIAAGEATLRCPGCEQLHHRECWDEVGGCSTYGCEEAPAAAKEAPSEFGPTSAWGDNKRCPACGETIKAIALRCRYCGTDFDTVDPLTAKDLRRRARTEKNVQGMKTTVIVVFILAVIPCLAPIALIAWLCAVMPKREALSRAGPFYVVLSYSGLAWSVLCCILMLIFGLVEAAGN